MPAMYHLDGIGALAQTHGSPADFLPGFVFMEEKRPPKSSTGDRVSRIADDREPIFYINRVISGLANGLEAEVFERGAIEI